MRGRTFKTWTLPRGEGSALCSDLSTSYAWPLYTGLTLIIFPAQNFKLWAVWQNENHSVAAEPRTSQQGATLKSCSNNIKADMAPLL